MKAFPTARIATWMSLSLVAFTLAGSLMLLVVFQRAAAREDIAAFAALARANAAFLDRSTLPRSEKMAAQLKEILGVEVWFETRGGTVGDVPAGVPALAAEGDPRRVGHLLVSGHRLPAHDAAVYFARPAQSAAGTLRRLDTWVALAGFWLLAGLLGVALARRVARPLSQFAAAVPRLAEEKEMPALPVQRADEIGQLARSFETAHRALNDERDRRRAAERLALLGRMTASLAHEVRNPLAAIRLHAQLLDGADAEESRASRELIESEAARIDSLVTQWLHYARPAPPVLVRTDLSAVVARILKLLAPQAAHARVSLENAALEPAWSQGDADRLGQALSNLALNAIQSMPGGGRVRVTLQSAPSENSNVPARHHCLCVSDEGSGFSAAALARAGDAFFSEREGGMGLGLTVAAEVCRAHGGNLRWENAPGGGARVCMELPALVAGDVRVV